MKPEHYIETLKEQHRLIDIKIKEAYKEYAPDEVITSLKQLKLAIKDSINKHNTIDKD